MLKSLAFLAVLAVGCKGDSESKPQPASTNPDDPAGGSANPGTRSRSGKIDLGTRRHAPDDHGSAATPDDERDARRRARLATIDTDGDGEVSEEERKVQRETRAKEMHKHLDIDKDGKVTPDEAAKSRFRRLEPESMDIDKNGDISVAEIQAALEAKGNAWGAGRFRDKDRKRGRPSAGSGDAGSSQ